jgi:dethiobiotin synthetase
VPRHGLFVTGTDTGVGKTVVSAAIVAALRAGGADAVGVKPVVTGVDEPIDPGWPLDHELLAAVAGVSPDAINFARYGPAVSPHLAAELSGRPIVADRLINGVRAAASHHELVVVEGVGGLLVPLGPDSDVAGLAAALDLPLVVVVRPGLGTINHTLLTLACARERGLEVAGVVLNRWPRHPSVMERSNRATIERLGGVEVATLPELARPDPELLAAAAGGLPLVGWLSHSDRSAV